MKSPGINSGKTIGSYCSKARKYIEYAKGYRFDDKVVNQRTYEIIRNSYSLACVFDFLGFSLIGGLIGRVFGSLSLQTHRSPSA